MNVKKVRKTSKGIGIGVILRECAGAVLRGGNWNNDVNTGVFASNLNNAPTNTNTNIGFRCVFVPGFWVETGWIFWRARSERARSFSSRNFLPLGNFSLPLLGHTSIERLLNTWDLKNLFLLILFFFSFGVIAREIDKVNKGDTIETIAKRNLPLVRVSHGKDVVGYAEDIKKWNPNIKDWKNPPTNQLLYVNYPYPEYITNSTWAPLLPVDEEFNEFNKKFYLSFAYVTSSAEFSESSKDYNVKLNQSTPLMFELKEVLLMKVKRDLWLVGFVG
ncbi:MAG: LysM peptidoglycan-binding domain-containing protein, partial [Bacteriovoracaceae bacterium]|nr:LysM peptidoglycan-binding domain-containing protein [Bacteriovoracaceae bacterium]